VFDDVRLVLAEDVFSAQIKYETWWEKKDQHLAVSYSVTSEVQETLM
jgi:hypothetical protein